MIRYNYVDFNGKRNLTILLDDELQTVDGTHPRFQEIYDLVIQPDAELDELGDALRRMLDPSKAISERFEKIGEQVAIHNGNVLFEGAPVNDLITDHIVRFYDEGNEDFKPLVKFLEKLQSNPNEHSREHLYRWLAAQSLTITPTGDFIAYKGVRSDKTSVHQGNGIVDGVQYHMAYLPNETGSVVEMPRDEVTFDPADGCSFGLHAGSWSYANGFGYITLEVHINPRDVVSVPVDCADQKLRTCRYRVVQELERPYTEAYVDSTYDWDEDDSEVEYDFYEGDTYVLAEERQVHANGEIVTLPVGTKVEVMEAGPDEDGAVYVQVGRIDFYVRPEHLTEAVADEQPEPYNGNYAEQFQKPASENPIYDGLQQPW